MPGIHVADSIEVTSDIGECQIQLCLGDIISLPREDKVDVLVISAFPNDYMPTPLSLIGQLFRRLKIDVRVLAEDKEEDLRDLYSCWWSKALPDHLSYGKILCFEGGFKAGKKSPQMAGDIFRCLVSALGTKEARVMMPLLASGDQRFSKTLMLKQLVKAAIHWIEIGLPLRCLKIVLLSTDPANAGLLSNFNAMKKSYYAGNMRKQKESSSECDVYLSYSEEDRGRVENIIECLRTKNKNITVFSAVQELVIEESWQEQLYDKIISCRCVMALLTPAYLKSTSCCEQYNIALCLSRKSRHNFLIPLYIYEVEYMPTYMGITQYIDCRVDAKVQIAAACETVIGRCSSELEIMNRLSLLEPYYDVFLSYSHFNEDTAKKWIKELRIYQPDIHIFIDTMELKAGGTWQQTLYEAIDRSRVVIALISSHYLRSKICIEELSLAVALQCRGAAKLWAVVIEPLTESVPWLNLVSPVECQLELTPDEKSSDTNISGLCRNILKDRDDGQIKPNAVQKVISTVTTLRNVRSCILSSSTQNEIISIIAKGAMLSEETESGDLLSSKERLPNHVDIYILCSEDDVKYCQLFCQLVKSQNQSLVIKKSFEETYSSRLSYLETASLVMPLLSPSFLSCPELIHELNIAWCRQRYAQEFCFLAIILDSLPVKPTYVHLLPCFFNCKDNLWQKSVEMIEIPSRLRVSNVGQEVVRCFSCAIKWILSWMSGKDIVVRGLHNKFINCIHVHNCLEQLANASIIPSKIHHN